jgi:hypothetical protein
VDLGRKATGAVLGRVMVCQRTICAIAADGR